jgi:hypothetical protein
MPANPKIERVLARVEPGRRDAMRKILAGAVYAAPVVASFSMASLDAHAIPNNLCANQTRSGVVAPDAVNLPLDFCEPPTVPTLSPWSLVGLAGTVSLAGAWLLRRRRGG